MIQQNDMKETDMAARASALTDSCGEAAALNDAALESVVGGNSVDRGLVLDELKAGGFGEYLITGKNDADTLAKTCRKYKIKYTANAFSFDTFEFDGHKFSSYDLKNSKNRKLLEDYIKDQL